MTIVKLEHVGEFFVKELLSIIVAKDPTMGVWQLDSSVKNKAVLRKIKLSAIFPKYFKKASSVHVEIPLEPLNIKKRGSVEFDTQSRIDVGVLCESGLLPIEVKTGVPLANISKRRSTYIDPNKKIAGWMLYVLDRNADAPSLGTALANLKANVSNISVAVEKEWMFVVTKSGLGQQWHAKHRPDYKSKNPVALLNSWKFKNCKAIVTIEDLVSAAGGKKVANHILKKLINSDDFISYWYLDSPE